MTVAQALAARLWWGALRRPFEALVRRTVGRGTTIVCGPLRGRQFQGGLSKILGIYELPMQEAIRAHLDPGDVFYDVGAHIGYLSLLAACHVGPEGHVYAFEPFPENAARVRTALAENKVSNATLIEKAVSNGAGTANFFFDETASTATSSLMSGEGQQALIVPTLTLDAFAEQARPPKLVKIDVEGAEGLVMEGAARLLQQDPAPTWLIEIHSEAMDAQVLARLAEFAYRTREVASLRKGRPRYPYHLLAWKA